MELNASVKILSLISNHFIAVTIQLATGNKYADDNKPDCW